MTPSEANAGMLVPGFAGEAGGGRTRPRGRGGEWEGLGGLGAWVGSSPKASAGPAEQTHERAEPPLRTADSEQLKPM